MKKTWMSIMLGLFLVIGCMTAFAADESEEHVFADAVVETVIRDILEKPEGPITEEDMRSVEEFSYSPLDAWYAEGNTADQVKDFSADAYPAILSIDDLAHCTSLRTLWLYGQSIDSLEALRGLTALESVDLTMCESITDLSPLSGKESLHTMSLSGVPVQSYEPVFSLPNLTVFVGSGFTGGIDLSPLAKTRSLETFFLHGVVSKGDYSPLTNHPNMKSVALYGIDSDMFITLMQSWPHLGMFDISNASITSEDLETIADHKLTHIKLYNCPGIVDLTPLIAQREMLSIFIVRCGVEDVTPLTQMPSLSVRIELRENPVTDLTPLAQMKSLERLVVSKSDAYTQEELEALLPETIVEIRQEVIIPAEGL